MDIPKILLDEEFVEEFVSWNKVGTEHEGVTKVADGIVGTSRWSIEHRVVVRVDDQHWSLLYRQPATEMQEEETFERYGLTWVPVTPLPVESIRFVDVDGNVVL